MGRRHFREISLERLNLTVRVLLRLHYRDARLSKSDQTYRFEIFLELRRAYLVSAVVGGTCCDQSPSATLRLSFCLASISEAIRACSIASCAA